MAFLKAIRLAFAALDLLRNPELCAWDRMLHVMGQCTSLLVALHCTFLENSSHFSLLSPIAFAHELPRTWWLSASSSCAAMKQQSLLVSLTGATLLDLKASTTLARQTSVCQPSWGQPQKRPGVGLPVVSEGTGLKKWG